MPLNRVETHFESLRKSLLSMYEDTKSATHTVVTGSLREGFIRAVLQGHLPSTASWSTGQIVGHAPLTPVSGQLDLVLHSGELPQIYIHDGFIRLVPSDACIAIVEVKSELTTGKIVNPNPTDVLSGALSSLLRAKEITRSVGNGAQSPAPFHILAFTSKVSAAKVVQAVHGYLLHHNKAEASFWPDSVVVLQGAKKTEPEGYGIFKVGTTVTLPVDAEVIAPPNPIADLALKKVSGWQSLAALVALLANEAAGFPSASFRLEKYIYALPPP